MITAMVLLVKPHLASVGQNARDHWVSLLGNGGAWIGAITARQEQVSWWTKEFASIAAITVSVLTAIHIIKNWNKKKNG